MRGSAYVQYTHGADYAGDHRGRERKPRTWLVGVCDAMLRAAITDLHHGSGPGYGSALRWLSSTSESPLGFEECCWVLGLNPDRTRDRIRSGMAEHCRRRGPIADYRVRI